MLDKTALEDFFAEHGEWGRYKDYDGDGIPYRTLPGTDHPRAAYFTRGTGHDEYANYSENSVQWLHNMARLHLKFDTARSILPAPEIDQQDGVSVGIISFGSNDPAIQEARDRLREDGIETNYLRIRALPLREVGDGVRRGARAHLRRREQFRRPDGEAAADGDSAGYDPHHVPSPG